MVVDGPEEGTRYVSEGSPFPVCIAVLFASDREGELLGQLGVADVAVED